MSDSSSTVTNVSSAATGKGLNVEDQKAESKAASLDVLGKLFSPIGLLCLYMILLIIIVLGVSVFNNVFRHRPAELYTIASEEVFDISADGVYFEILTSEYSGWRENGFASTVREATFPSIYSGPFTPEGDFSSPSSQVPTGKVRSFYNEAVAAAQLDGWQLENSTEVEGRYVTTFTKTVEVSDEVSQGELVLELDKLKRPSTVVATMNFTRS